MNDNLRFGWTVHAPLAYKITVPSFVSGAVYAPAYAVEGDSVAVAYRPATGYMVNVATYGTDRPIVNGVFEMPDEGVTIDVTFAENSLKVLVNDIEGYTGASLEGALAGTDLYSIERLEVLEGAFTEGDWLWLKMKRAHLCPYSLHYR